MSAEISSAGNFDVEESDLVFGVERNGLQSQKSPLKEVHSFAQTLPVVLRFDFSGKKLINAVLDNKVNGKNVVN